MGFCSFSREYASGGYTNVDNRFIAKYMPQADDLSVKVYLYGLFLCQSPSHDFSLDNCAEMLRLPKEKIVSAFDFWEDMDLVRVLCREPFTVEYLPVTPSDGKPRKIKYEKYADFNKELQRKMQTVGKFLDYSTLQRYMNFLQNNEMEQQAFLLIVEYCLQSSGSNVSHAQIFNKANNFIRRGLFTYSQVEKALSDFNVHTADLKKILAALGGYTNDREPAESDYALLEKWTERGFCVAAVEKAAKSMKKGTMKGLDFVMEELESKGKFTKEEVGEYLAERDRLCDLTFRIAHALGVKISSPLAYLSAYTQKWDERGYDGESLCALAQFCVKTERGTFSALDDLIEKLYTDGVVSPESVQDFLKEKQKDLRLLSKIQSVCGGLRRNEATLNTLGVWHGWQFSDEMILEAAKRANGVTYPLPYINKTLSEWKRENIRSAADIPQKAPSAVRETPAVADADARAERERWYARRRESAQARAARFVQRAQSDPEYTRVDQELTQVVREAAKAEAFSLPTLAALKKSQEELEKKRLSLLTAMGITPEDLLPKYACPKCSDTGFLPDGRSCDCYKK